MGLIDKTKQEAARTHVRSLLNANVAQLVNMYNNGVKRFWDHPDATPVEISALLGSEALELFQYHGALGSFITTQAGFTPDDMVQISDFGTFQPNAGGTITILTYKRGGQWLNADGTPVS